MRRRIGPGMFRLVGLGVVAAVLAAAVPTSAGAVENAAEFYARTSAGRTLSCAIYDGYAGSTEAFCEFVSRRTQSKATLRPNGSVVLCRTHSITSDRCQLGNAGEGSPTYRVGTTVTVGRFTCRVVAAGVRCALAEGGQGFLLGPRRLRGVGGATVRRR